MLAIKNKLNSMKQETLLSEERIRKFESNLKVSKQQLETALLEKEALQRKIEAVETQIINANKQREGMMEKCNTFESQINEFQGKRKEFSEHEKDVEEEITKLEKQLQSARDHLSENRVRCEEAELRLQSLHSDSEKAAESRMTFEKRASQLEKEIDQKLIRLHAFEEFELKAAEEESKRATHLKLLEGHYRDAEGRIETGKLKIQRLHRIVEQAEDEIEALQIRSRATQAELQNVIHTVVMD